MSSQYYKLTLTDAVAKYEAGDLTAKGLIHFYILIKCKPNWKIRLKHQVVCKELGVSKAAFYNAISRLRAEGSIDWEAPDGVLVSIPQSTIVDSQSTIVDSQSTIVDSQSTIVDSQSTIVDSQSTIVDSKTPERFIEKALGDSPDLLHSSYQIYINSLSDSERESFLEFGKKKANQLPKVPELPLKWIESHFEELRSQWEKSHGKVSPIQSQKWENHPQREEWLEKIRQLGPLGFRAEDMPNEKLRAEFVRWAEANNLIWGADS